MRRIEAGTHQRSNRGRPRDGNSSSCSGSSKPSRKNYEGGGGGVETLDRTEGHKRCALRIGGILSLNNGTAPAWPTIPPQAVGTRMRVIRDQMGHVDA